MLFLGGFILKPVEKAYDLLKAVPGVIFKIAIHLRDWHVYETITIF